MGNFIGRKNQLRGLKLLRKTRAASLAVLRGRRRIGKSRLAQEFGRLFDQKYFFSGLSPDDNKVTAADQRVEFIRQMHEQQIPCIPSDDWGNLFTQLANHALNGEVLIVLDEITWMCSGDKTFLGKLKTAWDSHFKNNDDLILIISGSNSAWIKKYILKSTGFYGRISYRCKLQELALQYCNEFWGKQKNKVSAYEKLKLLAVTGGVPRYLEEIIPTQSAEQNLKRLCYQPEGLLFNEFDDLFNDLFNKREEFYKDIVKALVEGKTNITDIAADLKRKKGGDISKALEELCQDGFIYRYYSWDIKTAKISEKTYQYRVMDNYFRFYIKHILPYKHQIEIGEMSNLPQSWESIIGLQFEHLVVNNRKTLHKLIGVPANEIVYCNPYLQKETKERRGCQIDYMVQTKFNVLYVCEIKFSKNTIDASVIEEVEQKLARLTLPRGFSVRPILVHVNGATDSVVARDYFASIVDFSELLQPSKFED